MVDVFSGLVVEETRRETQVVDVCIVWFRGSLGRHGIRGTVVAAVRRAVYALPNPK